MHALAQELWVLRGFADELLPQTLTHSRKDAQENTSVEPRPLNLSTDQVQRSILAASLRSRGAAGLTCAFRNSHELRQDADPNVQRYEFDAKLQWAYNKGANLQFVEGDGITIVGFNADSPVPTYQHTHWHTFFMDRGHFF